MIPRLKLKEFGPMESV